MSTFDLHDPKYYDAADLEQEMRRVFDVCHLCRMCFSYCDSFPSLFNAIDKTPEGEVVGLKQEQFEPVVDLCWQCKLCYVKCPYTPPHKFAVDFPRLMMRAKIVRARRDGIRFREKILGDPDRMGRMSAGFASGFVNWANRRPLLRRGLERVLGIHRKRLLPRFAKTTFTKWMKHRPPSTVHREPVALFPTCSVDYNYPQVGVAAVQVLEHNGKSVEQPKVVCCGLPALDGGDVDGAIQHIQQNLKVLLPIARAGKPILVLQPSCSLMMKSEWPQLVPTDVCREVAKAVMDIGEYLAKEKAAGRLDLNFTRPQGTIAYHIPCHLRAQNIGQPFRGILESIPGTTVEPIEQCSAFDGTWGMKTEFYESSRKCAGKLCGAIKSSNANCLISDCMLAGLNVVEETGKAPSHPLETLRDAYGLRPE
jgi:Fe-S oxidoreductase